MYICSETHQNQDDVIIRKVILHISLKESTALEDLLPISDYSVLRSVLKYWLVVLITAGHRYIKFCLPTRVALIK